METITIELASLFGDHHVTAVRKIILGMNGVSEVYASSAFRVVEVTFDPQQTNELDIQERLQQTGYLGDWALPSRAPSTVKYGKNGNARLTASYEQTKNVIGFKQTVYGAGQAVWPVPGMGVIKSEDLED